MIVGWGQSLVLHGLNLTNWHVLSLLNIRVPCIDVIFTSTCTISTGRQHLKKPCKNCTLVAEYRPSECKMLEVYLHLFNIYPFSCVSVAKGNHVVPCFSIRWKSKGFLFMNLITLILSWSLITSTLGKSILLPLKVTVTSFQLISNVFHK